MNYPSVPRAEGGAEGGREGGRAHLLHLSKFIKSALMGVHPDDISGTF